MFRHTAVSGMHRPHLSVQSTGHSSQYFLQLSHADLIFNVTKIAVPLLHVGEV